MGLHFGDTLAGKAFEHLGGIAAKINEALPQAPGRGADPSNVDGLDSLTPPHGPGNHHGEGPGSAQGRGPGPDMGGPSLPQGLGPPMSGPAPKGMQDVSPNITQQIVGNAFTMANAAGSMLRETLAPPTAADARPLPAQGQSAVNGPAPSPVGTQAQTPASAAVTTTLPGSAAHAASQANPANAASQPAATSASQTASATPRLVVDNAALMANRAAAEAALPPRPENASLLSRLATALHLGQPPQSTLPAAAPLPPGATTIASGATLAAGLTMAVTAANQPIDAGRGAILAANDHAATRAENAVTLAGHTLEGMQRRSMRSRMQAISPQLGRLLWAMGLIGAPSDQRTPNPRRDVQNIMQWLFWMLAIIAYGCLAAAIVALMGSNGHLLDYQTGRSYTGWLAFSGLAAGIIAWAVARRMARR